MRATKSKLEKLHTDLCDRFRERLDASLLLKISGPEGAGWENVPAKTRLAFWLTNDGVREAALHGLSGKPYPVYMLPFARHLDIGPWVGWYEEWVKAEEKSFELIGISLAFYWGSKGHHKKAQILRAEWDDVAHRGGDAGQPHWHIDTTLMVNFVTRRQNISHRETAVIGASRGELEELAYRGAELKELPLEPVASTLRNIDNATVQDLKVSGVHLAMGGWMNGNPIKYPGRWQCRTDHKAIVEWADSTLQYAIAEFKEIVGDESVQL